MILPRAPRLRAEEMEARRIPPPGGGDRFAGYGVAGLPFASGDILALRRFTASSVGPPFTSVWHRSPEGRWTCYMDVETGRGCPRYFGNALDEVVVGEIRLAWRGSHLLGVSVPGRRLHWALRFRGDPFTWGVSALGRLLAPVGVSGLIRAVGAEPLLGRVIGASPAGLEGTTPNGHRYRTRPTALWRVAGSAGMVEGRDPGPLVSGIPVAYLGTFPVAIGALFATGTVVVHQPPGRRAPDTGGAGEGRPP